MLVTSKLSFCQHKHSTLIPPPHCRPIRWQNPTESSSRMVFQIQRIDYQRFNDLGEIFPKQSASSSPSTDAPRNPEPPTLNASSTSIPNRERRCGVIEVVGVNGLGSCWRISRRSGLMRGDEILRPIVLQFPSQKDF